MSLAERALCTRLSISMWGGVVNDARATGVVQADYEAKKRPGTFKKSLLLGSGRLQKIHTLGATLYAEHNRLTVPWEDRGSRLLSVKCFPIYQAALHPLKDSFLEEVDLLGQEYPTLRLLDESLLNKGFRASDYPADDEIRGKFDIRIKFSPLTTEDDIRVHLDDTLLADMRAEMAQETKARLEAATADAWSRVYKAVEHFRDKLASYGPGKRMHETLLPGIISLCDTLPLLNLAQDPTLEEMASKVRDALTSTSLDVLKDSEAARADVTAKAEGILGVLKSLGKA